MEERIEGLELRWERARLGVGEMEGTIKAWSWLWRTVESRSKRVGNAIGGCAPIVAVRRHTLLGSSTTYGVCTTSIWNVTGNSRD